MQKLISIILVVIFFIPSLCTAQKVISPQRVKYEAEKVFTSVNSPFCSGRLLRDCPSTASADLKKEVTRRIENGETSDQVIDSLFAEYGDKIQAMPDSSIMGLVGWIVPVIVMLIGAVVLIKVVKQHKNTHIS